MGDTQSTAGTVMVPLTVEQRADMGDQLARLVEQIKGVKAEAKSKAFAYREEVERLQEEQEHISGQMLLGAEPRSQLDLFVGEDDARRGLAEVAAHACTCPDPENVDNRSPSCPVHGIGSVDAAQARADGQEAAADEALAEAVREASDSLDEAAAAAPSNVVSMADAIRANEVDVGTVEEPKASKDFREKRGRS